MLREWYEVTVGGKLVKGATKIHAMFSKRHDISLGRPTRWSLDQRQVSGEEEAGILGKGDEQEKELGQGGILYMEQEETQGSRSHHVSRVLGECFPKNNVMAE